MAWIMLVAAGILEIAFAFGLKASDGFTRPGPAAVALLTGLASVFLLSQALRNLPMGTGYAVWTGIGTAGSALAGMLLLGDSIQPQRLICIGLILLGTIGLKLVGG